MIRSSQTKAIKRGGKVEGREWRLKGEGGLYNEGIATGRNKPRDAPCLRGEEHDATTRCPQEWEKSICEADGAEKVDLAII
jgi:hypothetical protein